MSLREAAKKSGLSHAYIRDLELERNRSTNDKITPSPDTLQKLSIAYSYPYTELMIKAGHLTSNDIPKSGGSVKSNVELSGVHYIEIAMKDIVYYMGTSTVSRNVESLIDFSSFLDELEEAGFRKVDANLYVNFNHIRKYDERRGKLYFTEDGSGSSVTLTAMRQKKYHDQIMRSTASNTNKSLEFTLSKSTRGVVISSLEDRA